MEEQIFIMAKAKGGWGVSVTIEATPKKTRQGTWTTYLSILRLVEIKQRKDIEVRKDEEELYYESEKSV